MPYFLKNPKHVFLLDAIGGLISAVFLGIVFVRFSAYIGLSTSTLYFLAIWPVFFVTFDAFAYFQRNINDSKSLRIVAMLNVGYCLLSAGLLIYHSETLTNLAWVYFLVEIALVLAIAALEFNVARDLSDYR